MQWHIVCDFDGTIALDDATDRLLERFADPTWTEIEAEWKAGRIGSRDCMSRQIALVRATDSDLDALALAIPLDPGFVPFVWQCRRLGVSLTVVSDGLDRVIHRILHAHGLDHLPVLANHLVAEGDDRWRLEFPHGDPHCRARAGNCKCRFASAVGQERAVLAIGDGSSDRCVAATADFVFAKASLLAYCREHDLPHQGFESFGDLPAMLIALVNAADRPTRRTAPVAVYAIS
jgi:2-hydroxy-3-keto-5-methylthiopentenyl-1-phosphate phosphatase